MVIRLDLKHELRDKVKFATIGSIILNLIKEIKQKEAMLWDAYFKIVSNQLNIDNIQYQDYTLSDYLFYFKKQIYVSNNAILQMYILQEGHDIPISGYLK